MNIRLNHIFRKFLILPAVVFLYCLFFLIFYNLLKYDKVYPYDDTREMLVNFVYNFFPILAIVILNYFVVFRWKKKIFFSKYVFTKLAFDFIVSLVILLIVNYLFLLIGGIFKPGIKLNWSGTLLNSLLVFFGLETVYYINNSHKSLQKIELARRKAIQYQYDSLKMQINPHFLFNSLNILYSLVSIDVQKSKEFVLALSSMYRYILENQNKQVVLIKDELDFLSSYVSVLEMRYHNQFQVVIKEEEDFLSSQKMIPYTMQLLIENVTKHNVISTRYPMVVEIVVGKNQVTVMNPMKKKTNTAGIGIGLQYISEQYRFHNKFFETADDGKTFTAKIPYL
ncbi:histidine kinase [Epilithonimonas sp.]|uniref:sensor histidine kinase n=1 Tax=Epilithonimonas sp. TaxID=2894511 RepID=UPI0028AFD613|nr:histidine kinase [Epilithonimonas sp.]